MRALYAISSAEFAKCVRSGSLLPTAICVQSCSFPESQHLSEAKAKAENYWPDWQQRRQQQLCLQLGVDGGGTLLVITSAGGTKAVK